MLINVLTDVSCIEKLIKKYFHGALLQKHKAMHEAMHMRHHRAKKTIISCLVVFRNYKLGVNRNNKYILLLKGNYPSAVKNPSIHSERQKRDKIKSP